MFLHAKETKEIRHDHLQDVATVVLVDSVINSGKTIVEFVQHIKDIQPAIRLVVVAGVVQSLAIAPGGMLYEQLSAVPNLSFVTLRVSETQFTGTKGNDTGNRLFNTTHLE